MGSRSKVAKASPISESLRTTIPMGVVEQLDLKVGDVLDWDIRSEGETKYIIVRKVK